jgi:hypothetical protein
MLSDVTGVNCILKYRGETKSRTAVQKAKRFLGTTLEQAIRFRNLFHN